MRCAHCHAGAENLRRKRGDQLRGSRIAHTVDELHDIAAQPRVNPTADRNLDCVSCRRWSGRRRR